MMIIIVLLLVAIIIGLMFYNMSIHKKIDSFKNINQQITSLNVLQDFMDTISETSSVDDKLKKINDILIEKYGIKYSTIVVYNGAEFVIRASNVAEKHWETLKNLQSEPVFADSIETGIPKYITVEKERYFLFQFFIYIFQHHIIDVRSEMPHRSIQKIQLILHT